MTFYEYMQQQNSSLAIEMKIFCKLFPMKHFEEMSVEKWRKKLKEKGNDMAAFDEAAKGYENERD
jgi:hypothetical protein